MAKCHYCGQEMLEADGCIDAELVIEGRQYRPVRFGREPGMGRPAGRCGDCLVVPGAIHHPGCDVERCPCCGGQSIGCGCVSTDEGTGDDWLEEIEERFRAS